jgi:hypothetical protein
MEPEGSLQFKSIQVFIWKYINHIFKYDSNHATQDDVLFQTHIYILALSDLCFNINLVF